MSGPASGEAAKQTTHHLIKKPTGPQRRDWPWGKDKTKLGRREAGEGARPSPGVTEGWDKQESEHKNPRLKDEGVRGRKRKRRAQDKNKGEGRGERGGRLQVKKLQARPSTTSLRRVQSWSQRPVGTSRGAQSKPRVIKERGCYQTQKRVCACLTSRLA